MLNRLLRLIPRPLHRLLYRGAFALRVVLWRWRRPLVRGCRILARDEEGRVLLVRHSYGSTRWVLPGGGIARDEEAQVAAGRELREETGLELAAPRLLSITDEPLHGATNRVHLVGGEARGTARADGREITTLGWFMADALPEAEMPADMASIIRDGLARMAAGATAG